MLKNGLFLLDVFLLSSVRIFSVVLCVEAQLLTNQHVETIIPNESLPSEYDFTAKDEEQLLDDVIDQTAEDILFHDENSLEGLKHEYKRLTMDFNGIQVSYPTYVRLMRLQNKVIKLKRMIMLLHMRYSHEQLEELPQYRRLISLYNSLKPLLPTEEQQDVESDEPVSLPHDLKKRDFNIESFEGLYVPKPTYQLWVKLQEKLGKLDRTIKFLQENYPTEQLNQIPEWRKMVALRESLANILPQEQIDTDESKTSPAKRADFNGMQVSVPEFGRLMKMRQSVIKLDAVLRALAGKMDKDKLDKDPTWHKLLDLRRALQKLLPQEHPDFEEQKVSKRFDVSFNGMQVSYPQYLHLMALQRKVQKLDMVMAQISSVKSEEELNRLPQWHKLKSLRAALEKLLPIGH